MKILRVINNLGIGGAERGVVDNLPLHLKNGISIDLLLLDGVKTEFKKSLKKNYIKIYSLGKNISLRNPLLSLKLIKYLKKYDLIHVSLFPSLYWIALASLFIKKKPKLIFTEHATTNKRRNNFVFRIIDKLIYSRYDHIVFVSDAVKNEFNNLKVNTVNTSVIYNGINFENLNSRQKVDHNILKLVDNKTVILQVSGFRDEKDHITLIKAISELDDSFILLLVGDGKTIKECKLLTKQLKIENKVLFLGNQKDVGSIIKISDICVLSSFIEGFGRAAVECMYLKKPVIGTNVSGLDHTIGDSGVLFEVGDYKKLASIMEALTLDKDYYNFVANKCKKRAEQFDYKFMSISYEKLYKKILE